ncbi:Na+/H+ antiporter subunit A [Kurthia zopfii]|uniref:Na+/H+ antiporter subunit A n=1 Tax=Kurthia zopfii TaxID=1650 RepID=UPI000F827A95|nr:Na+/H+ antiporter subunit A [Kurthia zopfii]
MIIIPLIAAIIVPLLHKRFKTIHIGWFVLIIPTILFVMLLRFIPLISSGRTFTHTWDWIPSYNISFTTYLDGLSLLFALLITGIGSLVVLYSIFYLSKKESLHKFYCYLLLFMTAMLGVVFSDHLLVLYFFWEFTSVSSFLLIAFWHHRKASRRGAQKSMLITVSGGVAMLIGFLMVAEMTDSFSIREIISIMPTELDHRLFMPAMIFILLGAFTKSAQFPFHIWLPDAMEAPTPVSAYLHSATMVKAGIYLVARFTPIFAMSMNWFWIVSVVGLITLFWGSFNAGKQKDLKALLAFSTVSQLGLIMSLLGIGSIVYVLGYSAETAIYTQAGFAAIFHLMNHATFKGALFMTVGIIDHEVGSRDIRRLGGLMRVMPITFTIASIGSMSMAGLPFFNGFLSKEMFFEATLAIRHLDLHYAASLFVVVAWVASVLTFVYCAIFVAQTFFGTRDLLPKDRVIHEAPKGMLIAPSILAILVVLIFIFPNFFGKYILGSTMLSIYPNMGSIQEMTPTISAWHGFNTALIMTIGVIILGSILYVTRKKWSGIYGVLPEKMTFNYLYDLLVEEIQIVGKFVTDLYMTGSLRHYLIYIYLFIFLVVGGYFVKSNSFAIDFSQNAPVEWYEIILMIVMALAAVFIIFAKSRLTAVVLNGVIGLGVAIFFVLFRAPDLALTQLVVESVTTVLFLLCFSYLPEWKVEKSAKITKLINAVIAIGAGVLVVVISFTVLEYSEFKTISGFFENAYELVGGANIVNAILGDFRAFDTMLEVVVLLTAGLGVYILIKSKSKKERNNHENK